MLKKFGRQDDVCNLDSSSHTDAEQDAIDSSPSSVHVPLRQSIIEQAKMLRKYEKATSHLEKRANRYTNVQQLAEREKPPPLECMGRLAVLVFIAFIILVHVFAEFELAQN